MGKEVRKLAAVVAQLQQDQAAPVTEHEGETHQRDLLTNRKNPALTRQQPRGSQS